MLKYNEYILEQKIYGLLLESKIVYSEKFINILKNMKNDKIAKILLQLYNKDIDRLVQNYIDISNRKDLLSFITDVKASEISNKEEKWVVVLSDKYLTHSDRNNDIFDMLGYEKPNSDSPWSPSINTVGIILNEVISPKSGRVYVIFKEYNSDRKTVINKTALDKIDHDPVVWNTNRNNIKVGRMAKSVLNSANITTTEKEIEDFTNTYKYVYDLLKNAFSKFEVVSGESISYWYDGDRYMKGGGSLNNSCMSDVSGDYFNIYCYNNNISMVILYDDNGIINNGKYTSDKIKGRAILWKAETDDGEKIVFMDRIYTVDDSDIALFIEYADSNNWWHRSSQSHIGYYDGVKINRKNENKKTNIKCYLENPRHDYYPYCDTLFYLDLDESFICSEVVNYDNITLELRDTDGGYLGG
jgi:hypothetical protein